MKPTKPICVAITGASGAAYGLRLIECLLHVGHPVYLLVTTPGQIVIAMETELKFPGRPADIERFLNTHYGVDEGQLRVFGKDEWTAPMASGSGAPEAMVVCPCTMGALSAIACGSSRNLMERSADVMLKERKKLVLVARETPLSAIHLENMLRLTHAGAVILPANPGFYHNPTGINDLVDFVVARVLDQIGVEHDLIGRWGEQHDPEQ
ncbi:MAG TPA: UbiX family flavin prenyltransferase [Chromatiaceae bacterium]|nr:UbiX family flavin prenyltransferase [Chromatiaceae bacterium]HIO14418.1 UbiX family flavin prenyltransferase [Chromatiales bacterium]